MSLPAARFYNSIADAHLLTDSRRIDLFIYFLTEELGLSGATVKQIESCFRDCDLAIPKHIAPVLSKGTASKPPRFIKVESGGYKLERHFREETSKSLGAEIHTIDIPPDLRALEERLPAGVGKDWFKEALDCFGIEAYRAALVMIWIFALDHMFNYILRHRLIEFNSALATHPDQKAVKKVGQVLSRDDFSGLGEELFLDICRTAKIISPDVRKILGTALGVRNSAAHPSGVVITRSKVAMTAEDLMVNVVLKYPI